MTLRQLAWAADRRARMEWGQTAHVLAMIHNVNCVDRSSLKSPDDFNPFNANRRAITRIPLRMAKGLIAKDKDGAQPQ